MRRRKDTVTSVRARNVDAVIDSLNQESGNVDLGLLFFGFLPTVASVRARDVDGIVL
jgi:hypothetical protein